MFQSKIFVFFLFSVVVLEISNVTSLPTSYLLFFFFVVFAVNQIIKQIPLQRTQWRLIILFFVWIAINVLSSIHFNRMFKMNVILFGINNLLLPYYIYKEYNIKALLHLEKIVFFLTIISLPLYLLNCLFPSFFNAIAPYFKFITRDVLANSSPTYWTSGFYTNAIGDLYLRNCGFMWEPGRFAVVLVFFIIIHWLLRGVKFDKRTVVYGVALLTTFSTAGYISFFLLFCVFIFKTVKPFLGIIILLLTSFLFFIPIYTQSDFMKSKIDNYMDNYSENQLSGNYSDVYQSVKLSRFQIFVYDLHRTIRYPLGYGRNFREGLGQDDDTTGTNGLSGMLLIWGIPLFLFWMYYLFLFIVKLSRIKLGIYSNVLLFVSIIIQFFSQNVHLNFLTYFLIMFAILIKKKYSNEQKCIKYSRN